MAKKLLFVSEDITLAQIVRLKALADSVAHLPYEIHFASSNYDPQLLGPAHFEHHKLYVLDKQRAARAIEKCQRLYSKPLLETYVHEDLKLIRNVQPDLIIGDFRLSLPVSAEICDTPYASLINAYWSPLVERKSFPMPDHPLEKRLGYDFMYSGFLRTHAWFFRHFTRPINQLRRRYRLEPFESLQEWLTCGDYVLFPDTPDLVPLQQVPENQLYLGPVLWSPNTRIPEDIESIMDEEYIYLTLGSSGRTGDIQSWLSALADLPVKVAIATAGRFEANLPANCRAADYLPGDLLAERAQLVVSNGGSTTGYQALCAGKPVVGIASNLDQHLCMQQLNAVGVGAGLRNISVTGRQLKEKICELLGDHSYHTRARSLASRLMHYDYRDRFAAFVEQAV